MSRKLVEVIVSVNRRGSAPGFHASLRFEGSVVDTDEEGYEHTIEIDVPVGKPWYIFNAELKPVRTLRQLLQVVIEEVDGDE